MCPCAVCAVCAGCAGCAVCAGCAGCVVREGEVGVMGVLGVWCVMSGWRGGILGNVVSSESAASPQQGLLLPLPDDVALATSVSSVTSAASCLCLLPLLSRLSFLPHAPQYLSPVSSGEPHWWQYNCLEVVFMRRVRVVRVVRVAARCLFAL